MTLDHETYLKVHAALSRCQRTGWDPAEDLDRLGLILSPHVKRELTHKVLGSLLTQLGIWRPAEMLRRKFHPGHQCSPADMYVVMMEFIEEYRNKLREEADG